MLGEAVHNAVINRHCETSHLTLSSLRLSLSLSLSIRLNIMLVPKGRYILYGSFVNKFLEKCIFLLSSPCGSSSAYCNLHKLGHTKKSGKIGCKSCYT